MAGGRSYHIISFSRILLGLSLPLFPLILCIFSFSRFPSDPSLYSGTVAVVMGVQTPHVLRLGCPTPTILVNFVTCNWLLSCTNMYSGHFIVYRHLRHRHSRCPLPRNGKEGRVEGEEDRVGGRNGGHPSFETWLRPCLHSSLIAPFLCHSEFVIGFTPRNFSLKS